MAIGHKWLNHSLILDGILNFKNFCNFLLREIAQNNVQKYVQIVCPSE